MTDQTGRRFGRRHRRIAWTAGILVTAAATGSLVAWKIHRDTQPEEYVPGEASAEITTSIADRAARAASVRGRSETRSRRSDPLRAIGRALPAGAPAPRFTDVTSGAGLAAFKTFAGNRTSQLPEDMGGGAAWGDFNNDGFDDLFLVSAGGSLDLAPDRRAASMLFRNRGDGTFERVRAFPELRILGMGAAWGDYDGDGWLDLAVTGYGTLLLFRNRNGTLERHPGRPEPRGFWTGVSWGDYNRDGRLDLYVCGYVRYVVDATKASATSEQFGQEVPYTLNPASFDAERNLLFRNDGHGRFTEVAEQLGVDNPEGRSLSALWHDFDDDGWLDLYVANDISENKLYLNRAGKFTDAGHGAWVAEYRGSMGLAAADVDRDGDDDLFISHWVAQQFALYASLLADNASARNGRPGLRFTDVAEMTGIGQPSLQKIGWGAAFADFDSDGWLDLAVANGSTFETKDSPRRLVPMESFLFWNSRGRFFHDLSPWNQSLGAARVSRGLAVSDFDNDGSPDILIVDLDGGARLLRNDLARGNWIELRLAGRHGFSDGALVTARCGGRTLRATVGSASYLSQDSRTVHLGLGDAGRIDSLEVRWPDGSVEQRGPMEAGRIWGIVQGQTMSREQIAQFWTAQRAAMDAMKRAGDTDRAITLFRDALVLNPAHEDSRYYLANCLVAKGDVAGAISELEELARLSPMSHRAWQRRGVLFAATGRFASAQESLERAHRINPEETGTLLLLGEVALARGDLADAERRFELACRMNARSVGGLFLRAYVAWRRGDAASAKTLLSGAHAARGPEWKPRGSVAEGDVKRRMFDDASFLAVFWEKWHGAADPAAAFPELDRHLRGPGM